MHLFKFGLLAAKHKIYFQGLIYFVAKNVLKRKHISASVVKYQACDNLDYRISDAIIMLMAEAHRAHPIYKKAASSLTNLDLLTENYMEWYKAGLASGDAPFIFYSGYVYGTGLLYRVARQAISMDDGLMCYALMLPSMGLFKICSKHNLAYQCFLSLAKLMSTEETIAKALIGNITMSRTGRPNHNEGVDEGLEDMQGVTKNSAGSLFNPVKAVVHTALGFFFEDVRNNLGNVSKAEDLDDAPARGQHVPSAHADTNAVVDALRPMNLFTFDAKNPRSFGGDGFKNVRNTQGYLFPKGYQPPATFLGIESGGLINWTMPPSSTMPVYAAATRAATEYLQRMGLEQLSEADDQSEDCVSRCEACTNLIGSSGHAMCANPLCDIVLCADCKTVDGDDVFCSGCAGSQDDSEA